MKEKNIIPVLIEKFWETIPPTWHQTRQTIRQVAVEQFKMTVEQFQVLRRIHKGFDEVSTLANTGQTSRSSVSKIVDALVNRGLVSRLTDTRDRRHVHLALTEEGERLLTAIYEETESWLVDKFQSLNHEELVLTLNAMDILHKIFYESKE